ncbi:MAG: ABC transporter substrate-binding protein [Methanothrix sp.]|nr:ABC transporter substrate-binding protein [Methanothrix sp.]
MNSSWKIILAFLIALNASHVAWATEPQDQSGVNFTLEIFGNANLDDRIDEKDIIYVQDIINGENDPSDLADANQDNKIDQMDISQIKDIINGTESNIFYVNVNGDVAKVKHPLNRIVIVYDNTAEIIRILGAQSKVVGVDSNGGSSIHDYPTYFAEFNKTPSIGNRKDCDVEAILELKPDAVIVHAKNEMGCPGIEQKLESSNIDVVRLGTWESNTAVPSLMILAYMLDGVDNAFKYRDWQKQYLDMVKERVSNIPYEDRLRVFVDRPGNTTVSKGSGYSEAVEMAGGINIAADLIGGFENVLPSVDPEWVLEQNPDAIIGLSWYGGYESDNLSVLKTRYDQIMNATGISNLNAAKDNKVFVTYYINTLGPGYHIGVLYFAKWLYPELFEDLDPMAVHQEYIDEFQHVDYDLKEHGVFVYPATGEE